MVLDPYSMTACSPAAGSGAPEPIPTSMVKAVKEKLSIPLIVGGGIRTPEQAGEIAKAGADIIVTGTVLEEAEGAGDDLFDIIKAVRGLP